MRTVKLDLRRIPGHGFSGIVAELDAGATGYGLGDAVFGSNDWVADGATAEFCIAKPSDLSPKPSYLFAVEAVATPIGLLTAWSLSEQNRKKRERVPIHGRGAAGLFGVQLAKSLGAYGILPRCPKQTSILQKQIGANEVIGSAVLERPV